MAIDWGNPSERAALVERIGLEAYNKAFKEHQKDSTVSTVGGHDIQTVKTQFGKLFAVSETNMAFKTLKEAEEYARKHSV
jgi:predicted flavoprotein YhiN